MSMQGKLRGVRTHCRLLGYSPQAYYQHQRVWSERRLGEDLLLGQVLTERILQPRLGGRKLHEVLCPFMSAHRLYMGRDQFFDLLRENDLLVKRRRAGRPRTTDSSHWMRRYPDLTKHIILNRSCQLWVSDITYIRLKGSRFAYLSLVTDAYSRKIVGFHLCNNLQADGPVMALQMALSNNTGAGEPLIHHSDRGAQYCSDSYVSLLVTQGISISMTESGDPRDNAIAERVNGILKQELLLETYPGIRQAHQSVVAAVGIYNRIRPHSSVDMLTPETAHHRTGPIRKRWKSWKDKHAAV